jgi:hypothetical protein
MFALIAKSRSSSSMGYSGWNLRFVEPIVSADGSELVALSDAIAWLAKTVPKARHNDPDIQLAAKLVTDIVRSPASDRAQCAN